MVEWCLDLRMAKALANTTTNRDHMETTVPVATFSIIGLSPLVMHNSQLADPLNPHTKLLREYTSKRKKSDSDLEKMGEAEWRGGLYLDEDGHPCIPPENIEMALIRAAMKNKMGEQFRSGVLALGNFKLKLPKRWNLESASRDANFSLRKSKCVKRNRVMRVRPIFREWAADIAVQYDDSLVSEAEIRKVLELAGRIIGLGDERPRYGRFKVV